MPVFIRMCPSEIVIGKTPSPGKRMGKTPTKKASLGTVRQRNLKMLPETLPKDG